jgi:hypothetical protein
MTNQALWFEYSAKARVALGLVLEARGTNNHAALIARYDEIARLRDFHRQEHEATNNVRYSFVYHNYETIGERNPLAPRIGRPRGSKNKMKKAA